jgi:3',5'-cyclic AMP phosphodiesterase CpdA
LLVALAACSNATDEAATPAPTGVQAITTADQTLVPTHEAMATPVDLNPALPSNRAKYAADLGDETTGAGETYTARTLDGSTPPAPGPKARRLQLADDESPTRLGLFDANRMADTNAALRPQDANICRMVNASVRTINALHSKDPIDFVLLGGDNADSAQSNEVDWVMTILDGGKVECDSGDDDDPVPGPDNDGKDPFVAEGLKMPWKWVTGNHDVLVQGNVAVSDSNQAAAIGNRSVGGTRDYKDGGELLKGEGVVPDKRRALLTRPELMAKVGGDGADHGIGDAQKTSGKAYHHFDVPNTPLRFMVLDSSAETGGADGVIHQADVDTFVKPALDEAKAQGKFVILASHHASASLSTDGGAFGVAQEDAVTTDKWRSFIGGYDNVVFSMVAHSHRHQVTPITPTGGHAWWEVMTSAIADFPHEFRTVEIFDQDNGWLMLRATCVDFSVADDPVAAEGRRLGVLDFVTGWIGDGRGQKDERNIELYIKKPGS